MAEKTLAVKYRPETWDDVVEQTAIKYILQQQIATGSHKNAYLFAGGAGTGKTTCARIFAREINKHAGNPIELDAASNNSVDDMRNLIQSAKTKSLDSEYKVFIVDECHMITNAGWNALLKLIEEPPAKSIFIFCTTDPQKIPKTILSRVQRYDFRRISVDGIVKRLDEILESERNEDAAHDIEALTYLAKLADGGMRDAITLMDKCLAYSPDLTIRNIVTALGTVNYDEFFNLTDFIITHDEAALIRLIENVHMSGKDLKQFVKSYMGFVLDLCKYNITDNFDCIDIPSSYSDRLNQYNAHAYLDFVKILERITKLNAEIKWDSAPKISIEAALLLLSRELV